MAKADIYLDIVAPALRSRCSSCHNEGKKRGGLSVLHYDDLMKGGESGAVIVAGDSGKSDLYRRITLPPDNFDHMPKNNKTPLDADQIAAIRWWIDKGAPKTGIVADLKPAEDVLARLRQAAAN